MQRVNRWWMGALVATAGLLAYPVAMAVAEPDFQVQKRDGVFEIRHYPGFVVAETLVVGNFDAASRQGFRRVAAYIFGGNKGASGQAEKITMTAPVTVEPVQGSAATAEQWRLHFVMPAGSARAALPTPLDAGVRLREVPAHRMAAVRFSGFTTEASVAEKTQALKTWLQNNQVAFIDKPQVARYDDPFTLPWNRRNEILLPLSD